MTDSGKSEATAKMRSRIAFMVFSKFHRREELNDGYALYFKPSHKWRSALEEFAAKWRKTCPFFSIEILEDNPHDGLRLEIRGPEGTKNFIEGANHLVTSSLNPPPSLKQKLKRTIATLTADLRTLPDFLIIGAKKSGTTSLYSHLLQHPDVVTATRKEVLFFDHNYHRGLRWYKRHFPLSLQKTAHRLRRGTRLMSGEASPDYLFSPNVCERVAATMPDAKLIAILRNPVDRAFSAYQHEVRVGWETRSFEEAIEAEKRNTSGRGLYLRRGIYIKHINNWLQRFCREQVMICTTEAMEKDPAGTFRETVGFLGLRTADLQDSKRLNAVPYPPMNPKTRMMLREYYQEHNEQLGQLLNHDLDWS